MFIVEENVLSMMNNNDSRVNVVTHMCDCVGVSHCV